MALGLTKPLTEMSTRNVSWGQRRPVRTADNLTIFVCWLSWNLGASTSWNPRGLSRPVMGLLYLYIFKSNVLFLRNEPDDCTKKNAWEGALNVSPMLLVAALAWRDHLQSVRATVWEFIRYESTVVRHFTWQRVAVKSHVAVFLTTPRGFLRHHDHKFTLMDELLRFFHQDVPSRVTICNFYAFLLSVQWEEITSPSSPTNSLFNLPNNGFRLNLMLRVCTDNCPT